MNGKQAKRLRKQAEDETIGLPKIAWEDWAPPEFRRVQIGHTETIVKARNGIPAKLAQCTRKQYKVLKKEHKS